MFLHCSICLSKYKMFVIVAFLVTLLQISEVKSLSLCIPNTQFMLKGQLCACDKYGHYERSECQTISRHQICTPGQVTRRGCQQCLCQDNGQFLCSSANCKESRLSIHQSLTKYGSRCTPSRKYYTNCTLCTCPASGLTSDAYCLVDTSCSYELASSDFNSKKDDCMPDVIYLYDCIQCLCSKSGYFLIEKCIEKCSGIETTKLMPYDICTRGTIYRNGCSLCRCSKHGRKDDEFCIESNCRSTSAIGYLRTKKDICHPNSFTKPKCLYCNCNEHGTVDENTCLEVDCAKVHELGHNNFKGECNPNTMVPICIECFCLRGNVIRDKHCTRECTYQDKIEIIDRIISSVDHSLIDSNVKRVKGKRCDPNVLYQYRNKYCLCPANGETKQMFCTPFAVNSKPTRTLDENKIKIDPNTSCEPSTFVEFDCNTCFCMKNGTINPDWCTYDDCEAKKDEEVEQEPENEPTTQGSCTPGAISKVQCNFCICTENGLMSERACTKNDCSYPINKSTDKLTCNPQTYYEVDCNICLCPADGTKNVAKCTKNRCHKSFLRSDSCVPGELFSDQCNVCVCPPNGEKLGKACTNHVCKDIAPMKIVKLTENLLENKGRGFPRSLDLCFPGEEFVVGCKLCVCPEMGLKSYASCEQILCNDKAHQTETPTPKYASIEHNRDLKNSSDKHTRHRRGIDAKCTIFNISACPERKQCTPGTMYIIRCRECICPYMGSINFFCRPLPDSVYCEQAFPGFNYLPMGRRIDENSTAVENKQNSTDAQSSQTKHTCDKPGLLLDECFVCECKDNVVIEENCYKSDEEKCVTTKPYFSNNNTIIV